MPRGRDMKILDPFADAKRGESENVVCPVGMCPNFRKRKTMKRLQCRHCMEIFSEKDTLVIFHPFINNSILEFCPHCKQSAEMSSPRVLCKVVGSLQTAKYHPVGEPVSYGTLAKGMWVCDGHIHLLEKLEGEE